MGTISSKARIIQTIISAAAQYKKHLVGKTFLYVFEGHMIEVAYHAEEFRHRGRGHAAFMIMSVDNWVKFVYEVLFIKEKPPHSQLAVRGLCCSG